MLVDRGNERGQVVLSIIIPTLNSNESLGRTLEAIAAADGVIAREVIVADGGSIDGTRFTATDRGAIFLETRRGRGWQLAEGAAAAAGDWLLFLHADTRLAAGWSPAVQTFIDSRGNNRGSARDNDRRAAYFRFALDDKAVAARLLESIVTVRGRLFGLPYGDQGLLIDRGFYEDLGGFKRIPLMEDVDMVRRIGRRRLAALGVAAVTSAERYRRGGYVLRPLRNLVCLGLYSVGVSPTYIDTLYR
jgi:rSAM/selenodomain-associated transferase 2